MSIESRVGEALHHLVMKDYESAMIAVCIALDATAKEQFRCVKTGKRYRRFINANYDIITTVGFRGAIYCAPGSGLHLKNPGGDTSQLARLEDILYKTIRCALLHEASLPPKVKLTEESFYGNKGEHFYIPVQMIWAILLSVVGAACNAGKRTSGDHILSIHQNQVPLNDLWGNGRRIRELLGIPRTQSTS